MLWTLVHTLAPRPHPSPVTRYAQVIAAEGEHKASRTLRHAAEVLSDNPLAMQLRWARVQGHICHVYTVQEHVYTCHVCHVSHLLMVQCSGTCRLWRVSQR